MISIESYQSPRSFDEALHMMTKDTYRPIAGGTDLILQLRNGQRTKIMDIGNIGLDYINEHDDEIEIGAAVTHTSVTTSPIIRKHIPLVATASGMVGSRQIRNRGTIGGNIMNASPCADTLPALLDYDCELVLMSEKNSRRVKLSDFIKAPYETNCKPDELLKCIICKKDKHSTGRSYIKLGRRQAVNISRMTVSVSLRQDENDVVENIRIAAGSVFPVTSRMDELEKLLLNQKLSPALIKKAGAYASKLMIERSGHRWSTPYKEVVLTGMMMRALTESSSNITELK